MEIIPFKCLYIVTVVSLLIILHFSVPINTSGLVMELHLYSMQRDISFSTKTFIFVAHIIYIQQDRTAWVYLIVGLYLTYSNLHHSGRHL